MSWWAIVGPVTSPTTTGVIVNAYDAARTLDGDYSVGPLTLSPGDRPLIEYFRGEPTSLDSVVTVEVAPAFRTGRGIR